MKPSVFIREIRGQYFMKYLLKLSIDPGSTTAQCLLDFVI